MSRVSIADARPLLDFIFDTLEEIEKGQAPLVAVKNAVRKGKQRKRAMLKMKKKTITVSGQEVK
jgi:hypothetical protein